MKSDYKCTKSNKQLPNLTDKLVLGHVMVATATRVRLASSQHLVSVV